MGLLSSGRRVSQCSGLLWARCSRMDRFSNADAWSAMGTWSSRGLRPQLRFFGCHGYAVIAQKSATVLVLKMLWACCRQVDFCCEAAGCYGNAVIVWTSAAAQWTAMGTQSLHGLQQLGRRLDCYVYVFVGVLRARCCHMESCHSSDSWTAMGMLSSCRNLPQRRLGNC